MSNEGDISLSNSPTQPPSLIIPCQDVGPSKNRDSVGASSSSSIDVGKDVVDISNEAAASTDVNSSTPSDINANQKILDFQRRFFSEMATAYHLVRKDFPGLVRGISTKHHQRDQLEKTLLEEKIKSTKHSIEATQIDIQALDEQIEAEKEKGRNSLKEEKKKLLDEVRKLFAGSEDVTKLKEADLLRKLEAEVDEFDYKYNLLTRAASSDSKADMSK